MITNPTQRHTARPSRSRVTLARAIAWLDSHPVIMLAMLGALAVLILNGLLFLGLVGDGMTASNAFGVCAFALATLALAVTIAVMATEAHTTDKVARSHSRAYSRAYSRVIREHDDQMARAIGTRHASTMSAYELSAELARVSERETQLRHALRVKVRA